MFILGWDIPQVKRASVKASKKILTPSINLIQSTHTIHTPNTTTPTYESPWRNPAVAGSSRQMTQIPSSSSTAPLLTASEVVPEGTVADTGIVEAEDAIGEPTAAVLAGGGAVDGLL